jgi:hypothetical protein
MNTPRNDMGGFGDSYTSGVIATGLDNPSNAVVSNVETWNGSAWTEVSEVNTGRQGPGGFGSTSEGIIAGGRNPSGPTLYAQTESWNGASWTEVSDLATARFALQGGGSSPSGIVFGGATPPSSASALTEEFTQASSPILVEGMIFLSGGTALKGFGKAAGIPAATWASGGNLNTARYGGGSSGVTTAGLVYTGRTPPYVTNTESYDGSSWTEVNDVNSASYAGAGSPAGSYTAALKTSGKSGPSSVQANTEVWDGTNWTEVNDVNTARDGISGAGTSTSNIIAGGGQGPPYPTIAESWNGTSWTEVSDLNTAKGVNVSWGSSNLNAIVTTGEPGYGATTEIWNGSSWTETTDVNNGRTQGGGFGSTSADGILTGGYYGPGYQSSTESWNGTTWTEVNNMSTARGFHFGSGTSGLSGFVSSGAPHPISSTEHWTVDAALSTVTVS